MSYWIQQKMEEARSFKNTGKFFKGPQGRTFGYGITTPSDQGYAPGCVFVDTVAGIVYRNSGSVTSATWSSIIGASTTLQNAFANGATISGAAAATPMYVGDGTDSLKLYATNASNMAFIATGGSADITIIPNATLNVTGTLDVSAGINAATGNAFQVADTGAVTAVGVNYGTGSLTGTGNIAINTNKFTVNGTSGDVVVGGTLTCTAFSITNIANNLTITPTATTGQGVTIDGGTVTTGDVLYITYDSSLTSGYALRLRDTTAAADHFTVGDNGATTIAGVAAGTNALTLTAGDARLTSGNFIVTAGVCTLAPAAVSTRAINVTGSGARTTDLVLLTDTPGNGGVTLNIASTASNNAARIIKIAESGTVASNCIDISYAGASTGDAVAISLNNAAVTAQALTITSNVNATSAMIGITSVGGNGGNVLEVASTSTHSNGGVIQITESGAVASNLIELAYGGANTGDAINVTMNGAAVSAQALVISSNVNATSAMIAVTSVGGAGGDVFSVTSTSTSATGGIIKVVESGAVASSLISLAYGGANTGDAITIAMANAAAASQAIVVTSDVAHSGNMISVACTGALAAGTGKVMSLSSAGNLAAATAGAVLTLAESGAAQATSYVLSVASTNNEAIKVSTGLCYFAESISVLASPKFKVAPNYVQAGGANDAITATLTDAEGTNIALTDGLTLLIDLNTKTLAAGAITLDYNGGGVVNIVSSRNTANNIGTAYAANGFIQVSYNSTAGKWVDLSQ
jgi:hypothetical protein